MIREVLEKDFSTINEIGEQIKKDFNKVYDIENFVNKDYARIYVFEIDNKVIGFIQIEIHYEIVDIINIAVDKDNHNKGIGEMLINSMLLTINAEKVLLEVRESNISAINLYSKCGFKEINRRKKYYDGEDAIIMERILV